MVIELVLTFLFFFFTPNGDRAGTFLLLFTLTVIEYRHSSFLFYTNGDRAGTHLKKIVIELSSSFCTYSLLLT